MKPYSSKDVLRLLHRHEWRIKAQHGSHVQLDHPAQQGKATVPHPRHAVDPKTVRIILKQAGLSLEDLQ